MKRKLLKWTALALGLFLVLIVVGGSAFSSYAKPLIRDSIQNPIFTVGDQSYAQALKDGRNIVKFGPLPLGIYSGGVAFQSYEEAANHLNEIGKQDEGWDVYQLSGDFKLDTYESEDRRFIDKSLLVVEASNQEGK